jgi:excisionase family DNA binding protein
LGVSDVAKLLNCHAETVYRRIRYEGLPAHKDGARWKFDPAEVSHWMRKRNEISDMVSPPMKADNTVRSITENQRHNHE